LHETNEHCPVIHPHQQTYAHGKPWPYKVHFRSVFMLLTYKLDRVSVPLVDELAFTVLKKVAQLWPPREHVAWDLLHQLRCAKSHRLLKGGLLHMKSWKWKSTNAQTVPTRCSQGKYWHTARRSLV
jgi:hypothetical protein